RWCTPPSAGSPRSWVRAWSTSRAEPSGSLLVPPGAGAERRSRRTSLFLVLPERGEDAEVLQGGGVPGGLAARGHVAQQPAHDLPRPRLGQRLGEADVVRPGDGADLLAHVGGELALERVVHRHALLHGD